MKIEVMQCGDDTLLDIVHVQCIIEQYTVVMLRRYDDDIDITTIW